MLQKFKNCLTTYSLQFYFFVLYRLQAKRYCSEAIGNLPHITCTGSFHLRSYGPCCGDHHIPTPFRLVYYILFNPLFSRTNRCRVLRIFRTVSLTSVLNSTVYRFKSGGGGYSLYIRYRGYANI